MEFEFDKEIDAILRKARGNEVVTSFDSHLDADEISAFAENALPETARQRGMTHLADCTRCRKILSNVIALNSEAETETASSAVPIGIVEAKTPWYRKLFVFPQIAYTMGALVLLFSGFFGFLILKNLTSGKSEVSYSTDKPAQMQKSAPQNSSATATNAPAANVAAATNSVPIYQANTSTANSAVSERKSTVPESTPTTTDQPIIAPNVKSQNNADVEDDRDLAKTETQEQVNKPNASGAAVREENKPRDKNEKETSSKDEKKLADELPEPKLKSTRSAPIFPQKQDSQAGATRQLGGKTFNNVGGIWFDSAYTKQKQKIVRRGTSEYQKLDSELRSIADQFSGTVVVLWKSKAYRIQ